MLQRYEQSLIIQTFFARKIMPKWNSLSSLFAQSKQDTLFYDKNWKGVESKSFALSWLYHPSRLSQTSPYPFYLIFILVTSPIFGITTTLASCKVGCLVDVANIQVHCTINDFIAMIDEVHCKAIVKETAVMSTRHTRIDVCYLCQHLHTSLRRREYFIQ